MTKTASARPSARSAPDDWTPWRAQDGTHPFGLNAGGIAVLLVDLSPGADRPVLDLLTPRERSRAARISHAETAAAFVACRTTLRLVLAACLGLDPVEVPLETSESGRPFVAGSGLDFNVSHSGRVGLVALVAATSAEIGVDVELERPMQDMDRIADSYLASADRSAYRAADPAARDAAFFRGWVRAEAMLKADGAGIGGVATTDFAAFDVVDLPLPPEFAGHYAALAQRRWNRAGRLAERIARYRVVEPTGIRPPLSTCLALEPDR